MTTRSNPIKRSTKRIRPGRKTWANTKNNRELKKIFDALGIRSCEKCGSTFHLTWAHSRKRRFINSDEGMKEVALLCCACHEKLERLPHSEMFAEINRIIERRDLLQIEAA